MALKLDERYPGRANPPSIDYPQGSFKNRTSPDSKDGTYLEQDWANDQQGFLQSILSYFGITANGQVDKVGESQYFDALTSDPTDSKKGMPRQATQEEVDAGVADGVMVSPKKLRMGVSYLFAASGYLFLPSWLGGIGIQWGSANGVFSGPATISYPMSWPMGQAWATVCSCVNPAAYIVTQDSDSESGRFFASAWSVSASPARSIAAFRWIAVGR